MPEAKARSSAVVPMLGLEQRREHGEEGAIELAERIGEGQRHETCPHRVTLLLARLAGGALTG